MINKEQVQFNKIISIEWDYKAYTKNSAEIGKYNFVSHNNSCVQQKTKHLALGSDREL